MRRCALSPRNDGCGGSLFRYPDECCCRHACAFARHPQAGPSDILGMLGSGGLNRLAATCGRFMAARGVPTPLGRGFATATGGLGALAAVRCYWPPFSHSDRKNNATTKKPTFQGWVVMRERDLYRCYSCPEIYVICDILRRYSVLLYNTAILEHKGIVSTILLKNKVLAIDGAARHKDNNAHTFSLENRIRRLRSRTESICKLIVITCCT